MGYNSWSFVVILYVYAVQPRRPHDRFVKPAIPGGLGLGARAGPGEAGAAGPAPPPGLLQPASPMDTSSKD